MSRKPKGYWTKERLLDEASKYSSKREFKSGCGSAYNKCLKLGIIDDLFENLYSYWTDENVRVEASKYTSKKEFKNSCESAYGASLRLGIIDDLFDNQLVYWDEASIRKEYSKYTSKFGFQLGAQSAYNASKRLKILDDLGFEKLSNASDYDVFYIWRLVGENYKGLSVYKIGVTSKRLGERRISQVSKNFGISYDIIDMVHSDNALEIEKKVLSMGEIVETYSGDGETEVRCFDDFELENVLLAVDQMKV